APEPVQGRDEGNTIADEIAQIQKEAELAQSTFRTSSANDGGEEDEEESDGGLRLSSWRLNFEEKSNEITGGGVRERRAQDSAFDYFPELVKVDESEWSSESFQTAAFTTTDTVPSKIISVQFLEVDRDFNVINQDSTYVRDQDLVDGDVIRYESVSGRDAAVVPGGLNMVLRGVTPMGERVRNVFTITYTNDCDVYTFEDGEAMGWVEFVDLVEASPQTCAAGSSVTASPTGYAPRPPAPPSKKPSKKPSGSSWGGWDPDGYSSPWGDGYWGFSKSAKSKGSKGYVYTSAKSWKAKSSKAKSTKSSKMSKGGYWVKSSKAAAAPYDPKAQWGDDGVGSESSTGGGRVSSSKWTHVEPIRAAARRRCSATMSGAKTRLRRGSSVLKGSSEKSEDGDGWDEDLHCCLLQDIGSSVSEIRNVERASRRDQTLTSYVSYPLRRLRSGSIIVLQTVTPHALGPTPSRNPKSYLLALLWAPPLFDCQPFLAKDGPSR
ncbi:hypothetical protein THAOC_26863, partial [Thalassiosira oceanica]